MNPRSARLLVGLVLTAGLLLAVVPSLPASGPAPPAGATLAEDVNRALGLRASTLDLVDVAGVAGGGVTAEVTIAGARLALELAPHSVRSPAHYKVRSQEADGSWRVHTPGPVRTLRGTVAGIPGARVGGAWLDDGLYAAVRMPDGEAYWVEPVAGRVAGADPRLHVVYHEADVLPTGGSCAAAAGHVVGGVEIGGPGAPPTLGGTGELCTMELACDADVEFYNANGQSVTAVEDLINLIIDTVNLQYESEVGITHVITEILVRTAEPDPYSFSDPGALLDQFRNHWNANHQDIPRDAAELFTGRNLSGSVIGIAYLGAVCGSFGYSVVETTFTNNFQCRTDLSAHELGHNWGAGHCSCSNPPFTMNSGITCANTFHPSLTRPVITSFRDSITCLDCQGTLNFVFPEGLPDHASPAGGTAFPVIVQPASSDPEPGTGLFHVIVNGAPFVSFPMTETAPNEYEAVFPASECADILGYFFTVDTVEGEMVKLPPNAPFDHFPALAADELVSLFADDFELEMGWAVVSGGGLNDGEWERATPISTLLCDRGNPGEDADGTGMCYVTDNDLTTCNSDVDNGFTRLISPDMDATGGGVVVVSYERWFSNSTGPAPFEDVFVVEVSDDGGGSWSELETVGPLGDEVVGGWFPGNHRITDAGIDATTQFRIRFTAQDLGESSIVEAGVDAVKLRSLFCDNPGCPWDLDGDLAVGINDFLALLAAWGTDPGGPPDFDGDGTVGILDFLALLANWGPCS